MYLKTALSLVFFILSNSIRTNAQSKHFISAGADLNIPTKKGIGGQAGVSLGGSVQYQYKFNAPVGLQIHAGYNHFKDPFGKISFLPIRAGMVGYLYQDLIYAYADAGTSSYRSSSTTGYDRSAFSFGVGVGYRLPLSEGKQFINISAYMNRHNYRNKAIGQEINYSWFNLRAAFGFDLGKKKIAEEK